MVMLHKCQISHLKVLLKIDKYIKINGLTIPQEEEIAPRFLLELAIDNLSQDPVNSFWWSPRLIVVDREIVGMISFKSPPKLNRSVEIGYGIIPSKQRQGFATEAVRLILQEAFSSNKVSTAIARTNLLNKASQRVLAKNGFVLRESKLDPQEGEISIWQKKIAIT